MSVFDWVMAEEWHEMAGDVADADGWRVLRGSAVHSEVRANVAVLVARALALVLGAGMVAAHTEDGHQLICPWCGASVSNAADDNEVPHSPTCEWMAVVAAAKALRDR